MVTQQINTTARRDVFQAIADPTRRSIIEILAVKDLTLNGIVEHFPISRPAISKHVKILEECGIISIEQKGRERLCSINASELNTIHEWLDKYAQLWSARFDALESYLEELQASNEAAGNKKQVLTQRPSKRNSISSKPKRKK